MTTHYVVALSLVAWLPATAAFAQETALSWVAAAAVAPAPTTRETLGRAKDFYASAAYEEALQVLERLHGSTSGAEAAEIRSYQVFCLVALGRHEEATKAIEALVRLDPMYQPAATDVSPRVRTFFEDARRPLLIPTVRDMYARGKEAFDRKEWATASTEFDRMLMLLDQLGPSGTESVSDLRVLAMGFRDLSKVNLAPPPAPVVAKQPDSAPQPIPVYGATDASVTAPVPTARMMPVWRPINPADLRREFRGALEVIVGEDGRVRSATLVRAVYPGWDEQLLEAAQQWQFRPATKDGTPVRYRMAMEIVLKR